VSCTVFDISEISDHFAADRLGTTVCHICWGGPLNIRPRNLAWKIIKQHRVLRYAANPSSISWTVLVWIISVTDRQTDRQTDRRTDRRTDGRNCDGNSANNHTYSCSYSVAFEWSRINCVNGNRERLYVCRRLVERTFNGCVVSNIDGEGVVLRDCWPPFNRLATAWRSLRILNLSHDKLLASPFTRITAKTLLHL